MKYLIRNKMARSWPGGTNRKLSALFFSAAFRRFLRPLTPSTQDLQERRMP